MSLCRLFISTCCYQWDYKLQASIVHVQEDKQSTGVYIFRVMFCLEYFVSPLKLTVKEKFTLHWKLSPVVEKQVRDVIGRGFI